MHGTVWTGRAVGKAVFAFRPCLLQLGVKPAVNHFLVAPSMDGLRSLERSCSSRQGASTVVLGFLRSAPSRTQHHAASSQLAWTRALPAEHAMMAGASPSLTRMFQAPPPRKRGLV